MQQQQQPLDSELSQQNHQLRQLAQQDPPLPTLQSVHTITPHSAEYCQITLVMMMMAKVQELDVFNRTNAKKLRTFLIQCNLNF
jgi:hypothetical protein